MKIYIITILLLVANSICCQEVENFTDNNDYWVISRNGLNLREDSTLQSKNITSIGFGEIVNRIDNLNYNKDTIGSDKLYYEGKVYEYPIVNFWIKVRYKNYSGYVFGAYLMPYNVDSNTLDKKVNSNYVLHFPGYWCNYNFSKQIGLNWYGLYERNGHFDIRMVELKYTNNLEMEMTGIGISTDDNKGLVLIIGSRKKSNRKGNNGYKIQTLAKS